MFSFLHKITGWIVVELEVSYLRTHGGDSVPEMVWGLLVKPEAPVDRVTNHLAAGLKSMSNKTISNKFNSFLIALADNRPLITTRLVLGDVTVVTIRLITPITFMYLVTCVNIQRESSHIEITLDLLKRFTELGRNFRR